MTDVLLDTLSFTTAKSHLSDVMTGVVHRHELKIVGRHNGKEQMLLVGRDDLLGLLDATRFEPVVAVSEWEFVMSPKRKRGTTTVRGGKESLARTIATRASCPEE